MMRAALIAVGLGALVIMELGTPPRSAANVHTQLTPSLIGITERNDTLMQGDRAQLPHALFEAPAKPVVQVASAPPPEATPVRVQRAAVARESNRHAASPKKVAVAKPKPRPQQTASRNAARSDQPKPTIEAKSCRPGVFDGLLKALSLASGCET